MDDGRGGDQVVRYCIIPDPIYRALILYFWDSKAERIDIHDDKYLLLDDGQISPLRRTYQMIINPKLKLEASIKATFDSGVDTSEMKELPGIPEGQE